MGGINMLGVYNYTVILTYFGMLVSFMGISFAVNGDLRSALTCLMVSGVCDMFDGKIASTKVRTRQEKSFGIQIDSLSDLICFGVLPAMIVCRAAAHNPWVFAVSGAYLLCALIRLAWFNVDEEQRQSLTQEPRSVYLGLPVTTAALLLPLLAGLSGLMHFSLYWAAPALLLFMAAAFLTPFPLKKPALPGKIGMLVCGSAGFLIVLMGVSP